MPVACFDIVAQCTCHNPAHVSKHVYKLLLSAQPRLTCSVWQTSTLYLQTLERTSLLTDSEMYMAASFLLGIRVCVRLHCIDYSFFSCRGSVVSMVTNGARNGGSGGKLLLPHLHCQQFWREPCWCGRRRFVLHQCQQHAAGM